MKVKIQLDEKAYMPVMEHKDDAGADLLTPYRFILRAGEYIWQKDLKI